MAATVWVLFIFVVIQGAYGLGLDSLTAHKINDIDDAINAINSTIAVVDEARRLMSHSRSLTQLSINKVYQTANIEVSTLENSTETEIAELKKQASDKGINIEECLTNEDGIKTIAADAQNELIEHLLYYSKFSTDNYLSSYENTTTYFDNFHRTLPNIEECDSHDCLNTVSAALINHIVGVNAKLNTVQLAFDTSESFLSQNCENTIQHDTEVKLQSLKSLGTTIIDCIETKLNK